MPSGSSVAFSIFKKIIPKLSKHLAIQLNWDDSLTENSYSPYKKINYIYIFN